ncbi:alpha/beta fold hydrolase [Rhodococcus sp. D-1]|nr:alpha/beta hydrolase [Rhodococcus sp. D-1]OMQ23876.1 hypothetical protein BK799_31525 [Rhodococcus sp. D-1]
MARIKRGFAATRMGTIHYAEYGSGPVVLLLHQTPRSWDEYREVLPLLGAHRRAIAIDTLGFGDSDPTPIDSIECYAEGVEAFIEWLGVPSVDIVGHHTGGVIAVEVAACNPNSVRSIVLSATPFCDQESRDSWINASPIDGFETSDDGSHLLKIWSRRQNIYPENRNDLVQRALIDIVKSGDRAEVGHDAVHNYRMENVVHHIAAPVLLICGTDDLAAFPHLEAWRKALPSSHIVEIQGGKIPLVEQFPELFSTIVDKFLHGTTQPAHNN